jgi:hypothetical protein
MSTLELSPIQLRLEGNYWDSQIYSGELILFDADGGLSRTRWDAAVNKLAEKHPDLQTAVKLAFTESNWLYTEMGQCMTADQDIKKVLITQLKKLASKVLNMNTLDIWQDFQTTEGSPFNDLPTDTDIYNNKIYAASEAGLYVANKNNLAKKPTATKLHDGQLLQIKASDGFQTLAASAGKDGLIEFKLSAQQSGTINKTKDSTYTVLSPKPCSACEWAYQSVIAWGNESAYFASFTEIKDPSSNKSTRQAGDVYQIFDLFNKNIKNTNNDVNGTADFLSKQSAYSWGAHEKIYYATGKTVNVGNYKNKIKNNNLSSIGLSNQDIFFAYQNTFDLDFDAREIVATATASFGTLIELDTKIIVLATNGQTYSFPGEATHWRIFNRSKNYNNQLHIIYEDHMLVISFVHDYFVDQSNKLQGFSKSSSKARKYDDIHNSDNNLFPKLSLH